MAVIDGKSYPVGARHARLYEFNASGYLNAQSVSVPYEGVQIVGAQTFEVTLPEYRRIAHPGDDQVLQTDFLPPTEPATATLNVGEEDLVNLATMTSVSVRTLGESKQMFLATDQQGNEPDLGLLLFQQSLDGSGLRNWRGFQIPRGRLSPRPSGFNENPATHAYQVVMGVSTKTLWGETLTNSLYGATKGQIGLMHTQYKPHVVAWLGDGTEDVFSFHADRPAVSTAKINGVWVNGVLKVLTTDYTVTTTAITFGPSDIPASGAVITCFYEYD